MRVRKRFLLAVVLGAALASCAQDASVRVDGVRSTEPPPTASPATDSASSVADATVVAVVPADSRVFLRPVLDELARAEADSSIEAALDPTAEVTLASADPGNDLAQILGPAVLSGADFAVFPATVDNAAWSIHMELLTGDNLRLQQVMKRCCPALGLLSVTFDDVVIGTIAVQNPDAIDGVSLKFRASPVIPDDVIEAFLGSFPVRAEADAAADFGQGDCPADDGSAPQRRRFDEAPPMCIDVNHDYTAVLTTSHGVIRVALATSEAPVTVNNFVVLARHRYYDETTCHRVVRDFVVQCGDPTGTGTGGPGYEFADELPVAGRYQIGSVAMANAGPDTNGSQFFIITGGAGAQLPPSYAIIGDLEPGQEALLQTLNELGHPSGADGPPIEPLDIIAMTIEERER